MKKHIGISLYPGLHNTKEEIRDSIVLASQFGVKSVFTSLHIPEANPLNTISDCEFLCEKAREFDMQVTADISPRTFSNLKASPFDMKELVRIGLSGIRADFGFLDDQLEAMIKNPHGMKIMINADSSINQLKEVIDKLKTGDRVTACHNFYPRMNSGLSFEFVIDRSRYLKELGLEVAAFVASQYSKRAVVYEGLPTVEVHRHMTPAKAARELFCTGFIDQVYVGDPMPSASELDNLRTAIEEDCLELRLEMLDNVSETEIDVAIGKIHYQPPDSGYAHVIRSSTSRNEGGVKIFPGNTVERPLGTVTLDNVKYGRYSGELQICLMDLPADPRVNVIGRITTEDLRVVDLIRYSGRFKFVRKEK